MLKNMVVTAENESMTPVENCIPILLVEDDADLCRSISTYLNSAGFRVTAVGSCLECYSAIATKQYGVAVVDVSLPDQSGFTLAEYLRANTTMKIIMMTAHERIEDRVRGYAAGAHNYLIKPVDLRELQAAIMSLTSVDKPSSIEVKPHPEALWQLQLQSWQLISDLGETVKLTSLELQLMELLAAVPGEVVSRETLLNRLYNRNDEHSGRALDSLVRRLRGKITSQNHPSPIKTAHAVGYCFSVPISIV